MTVTALPQYRSLRGLLLIVAILLAIGGAVILFDAQLVFLALPIPKEAFAHATITVLIQDLGAMALGIAVVVYAASRDPVRYISAVDALIVILVLLASVDVYAVEKLHFNTIYPSGMIWARVALRLIVAIVLLWLRPKAVY